MEYPVFDREEEVGQCKIEEEGLYWRISCRCRVLSDRIERLYAGSCRLGVLEREGQSLTLDRRISKSSCPGLPPESGRLSLQPENVPEPWEGEAMGQYVSAMRQKDTLLFPYSPDAPCPCEPLCCFFTVKDGFWQLPIKAFSK